MPPPKLPIKTEFSYSGNNGDWIKCMLVTATGLSQLNSGSEYSYPLIIGVS